MKTINVGVDLDGVCANWALAYSTLLRRLYGAHLPIIKDHADPKYVSWDWPEWYPVTKDEDKFAYNYFLPAVNNFWESFEIIDKPNWNHFVNSINSEHINTYFITTRKNTYGSTAVKQSQKWLFVNGVRFPNVIVTKEKGMVAKALNLDIFIDDKVENCIDVKSQLQSCEVFMIDYLYNRKIKQVYTNQDIIVTKSLDSITNLLV
jgi:hypothetical protein